MSAIIKQAKKNYSKALIIEFLFISAVSFLGVFIEKHTGLSLLLGFLSAFLPYLLFVYWVFFKPFTVSVNKLNIMYKGEALKWVVAIILIAFVFIFYKEMKILVFFSGYFVILAMNIVLPEIIKRVSK
ncbi:MAG: ATP synthase subunit I [Lonepinella koalarum]|nr:ATP synthase subunit I [Lonepinella koalarum]